MSQQGVLIEISSQELVPEVCSSSKARFTDRTSPMVKLQHEMCFWLKTVWDGSLVVPQRERRDGENQCSGCMWKGGGMEGWRVERRTERMMEGWRNRRMGRKEEGREGKMEGWKDEGSLKLGRQLRSSSPTIWSSGVVEVCNRERMEGWKGDLCTFAPKRDQNRAYTLCPTALSSHSPCPTIHTSQTLLP